MTMRVATYSRQSVDLANGIDRQVTLTRAEAGRRGWTVVADYKDNDVSASKERGPKTDWAKLLKAAKDKQFTHIIAVDLDRLLRTQRDLITLIDAGLKVVTVDGEIDLSTADGEFRASMTVSMARFETQRKSERQIRANLDRSNKGTPNPGRRRYGYESDGRTPRESEAVWVRWMFKRASEGASIRSIVTHLLNEKVVPGTGTKWSTRRIRDTLMNPTYEGKAIYLGVASASVEIDTIVEPDLAAKVRSLIADPSRKTSPGNSIKHLLSGIAICGVCAETMFYMRSYRCRASSAHPSINKDILDPMAIEEVFFWIVAHPEAEDKEENPQLTALQAEVSELWRRRASIQEMAAMDGADLALVRKQLAKIGRRLVELDQSIAVARGTLVRSGLLEAVRGGWWAQRDTKEYTDMEEVALTRWPAYWASLDLEKQREILRSMFKITVTPGRTPERVLFDWID